MSLSATNAKSLSDLRRQFGDVGLTVPGRAERTKEQKEAYLARRLILKLAEDGELSFPVSITQSDSPDFVVVEQGRTWLLEITEATTEEDQRAMTLMPSDVSQMLGESGGRGKGGYIGSQPEHEVISDINAALLRKRKKHYANQDCTLLVYVNSNPGVVVHMTTVLDRLTKEMIEHPFKAVYLMNGTKIFKADKVAED